jgi:phosphatidate cytidylyltransferase
VNLLDWDNLSSFGVACEMAFAILLFASVANFLLRRWKPQNETYKKVTVIVRSWWLIVGTVLLGLSWPKWGLILLFYMLTIFMMFEYLKHSRMQYKTYAKVIVVLLATLQYAALSFESLHYFQSAIPILCLWILPGLVILRATIIGLELVISVMLGMGLAIYYMSHIPAITAMPNQLGLNPEQATLAIVVLIIITWSNDVFQFICGKTFGKRKIVPQVSPNKTLGGFIGGLVCTTLITALIAPPMVGISFTAAFIIGPLLSTAGMLGDLFFSAVKRNMGIKDFSQALPGHGGLLDRVDSLIFTAPLYFHFLYAIQGGAL